MTKIVLNLKDDWAGDYIDGETWGESTVALCVSQITELWPALRRGVSAGKYPRIELHISDKRPRDGDREYLKFVPSTFAGDTLYDAFDSNGGQVVRSIYITRRSLGNLIAGFRSEGSDATTASTFYAWVYRARK